MSATINAGKCPVSRVQEHNGGNAMASTYDSPTGWYTELKPNEKRTFWACFGGWMLDAMDVQIFSFAIPAIIVAFAITNADAGLIGTVTLLTSALGGWFAGALSDRFGRVRTLQITIVWFAFFTFLCGFAQSYTQLFIFRALMGLGFGGEWAAGAVLMGEVIRAQHRGKAVGSVQSGWAIGWAIAAIMATWFFSVLPQDTAWRALFWVGILPAFLVFFVRRFVDEPNVFTATQNKLTAKGATANFMEIFSPALLKTTILTSVLATGAQGGYYAIATCFRPICAQSASSRCSEPAVISPSLSSARSSAIWSAHILLIASGVGQTSSCLLFARY